MTLQRWDEQSGGGGGRERNGEFDDDGAERRGAHDPGGIQRSAKLFQREHGAADPDSESSASTTTLSASANPSVYGQAVTFAATVAGTGGTPTGSVNFLDGVTLLGTSNLTAAKATLVIALTTGSHSITAVYSGDRNFNASTSPAITQTVSKASDTVAVTSSQSPSVYGQAVTFTASVAIAAPGSGTPTGAVTFKDGTATLGTATSATARRCSVPQRFPSARTQSPRSTPATAISMGVHHPPRSPSTRRRRRPQQLPR